MATTKSPKTNPDPGTNPGQDEFDKLNERFSDPNKAAGDSSDPRGDDGSLPADQTSPAGDSSDPRGTPSKDDLASSEKAGAGANKPKHDNQVGGGYKSDSGKKPGRFSLKSISRRQIIGGGILGGTIGAIIFLSSFLAGPFEFIHIAQLLEHWHFSSQQDDQDDRFTKAIRLYRYAKGGEVEKTRLGYVGNKIANSYETKLNKTGIQSAYSDLFGYHNAYVIDTTDPDSPYHGLDGEALQDQVEANTGVRPVKGSEIKGASGEIADKWAIDVSSLNYSGRLKLDFNLLQSADANKVSAAIGTRFLCERAGCTSLLHPLTKLVGKGGTAIEQWWTDRNKTDQTGQQPLEETTEETGEDTDGSGGQVKAEVSQDEGKALSAAEIHGKIVGGAAAATGILCVAKGIASQAKGLKAGQIQVLIRMGVEATAVGNQFESGQDVNLAQAAQYNTLLSGTDPATGQTTEWDQAASVQANEGNAGQGIPADGAVKGVTNDSTPFDFLNQGLVGTALGAACSVVGQIIQIAVGSVTDLVTGAVISIVLAQTGFIDDLAQWLAGNPINVDAVGAEYGSEIDYGAALAANSQAMLGGGAAMTTAQANALQSSENNADHQEFDQQSIADRLFNPYDERSAISKVIDKSRPSPAQNFASLGSFLFNFSHTLASLPGIFSSSVHAANTAVYNYGFPTYGFTQQDLDNSMVQNPYENACYVVGCDAENGPAGQTAPITGFLTGTTDAGPADATGQAYITSADKCFGVTIAPVSVQTADGPQMQWDVTSDGKPMPNPYDSKYPNNCGDTTDPNWLRLRFFILDTETMNAMGCYAGSDSDASTTQACTDVGFASSTTPPAAASGPPPAPIINSFTHNGGAGSNSFTYNVSNANSCYIQTDNPPMSQQPFVPTLNADSGVTAGNGGSGTLFCMDQDVGPVSQGAG